MTPVYLPGVFTTLLPLTQLDAWDAAMPWASRTPRRGECFMHPPGSSSRRYEYAAGMTYDSVEMDPLVHRAMMELNDRLGAEFNACFLNRYANDRMGLRWHSDDHGDIREDQPIAVARFGCTRALQWRARGVKGRATGGRDLPHGSVLVMPAGMQQTHQHQVPCHDRPCGLVVSMTFRSLR